MWYISKKEVAKEGVFNTAGLSPMESVEQREVNEVLYYLNIKALENKVYEEESKRIGGSGN